MEIETISPFMRFSMSLAAGIIEEPLQAAVLLFLLLLFPIICLSVLPAKKKI